MTHTIAINNTDLPALNYDNKPVVTFKMIDVVHQRPTGTATRNFKANRERFVEGKHFYLLDSIKLDEFRLAYSEVFPNGLKGKMLLITESGYLKLTKSFNDDLAWDIQDMLVDHYFRHTFPDEPRLDSHQVTELKVAVQNVNNGWLRDDKTIHHIHNRLRVHFSVDKISDISVADLPIALALVQSMRTDITAYYDFLADFRDWFHKEIIGNGVPWTPTLKGKFKKTFKEQLPAKPDWKEIEQQLKQAIK